ncbi:MAG: LCP family protein [Negativicutes bacterium]|nr:LCP family protein [Negativicutes bacterium]
MTSESIAKHDLPNGGKIKKSGWQTVLKILGVLLLVAGLLVTALSLATSNYLQGLNKDELVLAKPAKGEPVNLLLIGTDAGLLAGGGTMPARSDVLMLFSFDQVQHKLAVISIPRDTLIDLPEIGYERINAAHVFGGTALTVQMVEELLQTSVHYYAKVNFESFQALVDAVGGVDYNVEFDMDYEDPYDVPPLIVHLKAGQQVLDGEAAEGYVRYRADGMGDIGRVERQRNFMLALAGQLLQPAMLLKMPAIAAKMQPYLDTNLSMLDGLKLATYYLRIPDKQRYTITLPGAGQMINEASYWIADDIDLAGIWRDYCPAPAAVD